MFVPSPMKRLRGRYHHHFDPRRFDIDWSAVNYNRAAIVNLLLADRRDAHYLEIGCAENMLFDAVIARHKTGVDPSRGGTERLTSDEFFRRNPDEKYDVIFIDGLHVYDQAHRDLTNALRHLRPGGWIALHDMMPLDWLEEHVPRISGTWSGDVWKVAFELARAPHLDFRVIKVDRGVAVVRPLGPEAVIADLSAELADKRFGYFYDHAADLPIVDYAAGREWIEAPPSAPQFSGASSSRD